MKESNHNLATLVATALSQTTISGYSEVLRVMAQAIDAYGCILWQLTPNSRATANEAQGELFVLAEWFSDKRHGARHGISLMSVTGHAIKTQQTINVPDISADERVAIYDSYLHSANIRSMCSLPVRFLDNTLGALNFYRNTPEPLRSDDLRQAEYFSSLLPSLYDAIRNEVSLRLISRINNLLHNADLRQPDEYLAKHRVVQILQELCEIVADSLQCVETSIFLEDRLEAPGKYELVATNWTEPFSNRVYSSNAHEGLIGWVLKNAKPVRIFDLAYLERDSEAIHDEYPGLTWVDSLNVTSTIRTLLKMEANEPRPPLSFMAVPIVNGESILGVIRCGVPKRGLYYFSGRDVNLLTLVAAQITRFWNNWLSRRETLEENRSWQNLVESIGKLNTFVYKELAREVPDERRIFREALRLTGAVIEGAEIMDVRLFDEQRQELYYAETYGEFWDQGDEQLSRERRNRRFPVFDPPSAGALAFRTGETRLLYSGDQERSYYPEAQTKGMIIAPIKIEEKIFGVLDIRQTGNSVFPNPSVTIAQLLGQQLGLYCYLATAIRKLRKVQEELTQNILALQSLKGEQIQAFEDLAHQLKSPIIMAHARIQAVLKEDSIDQDLRTRLQAIRSLCAKARRVALSTKLFADFAQNKSIIPNKTTLLYQELLQMLIEAATDNEILISPNRRIKFEVETRSFECLSSFYLLVDRDLLDQAINNILDNAGKYGYPNTAVRIRGGITSSHRFFISFLSEGQRIHPTEIHRMVERGWRSYEASLTTGEGSGIGLWIVDHIMRVHMGELLILPTTKEGKTEVRLIFPNRSLEREPL